MYKSIVYRGEDVLGEVEVYPQKRKPGEDERRKRLNGVIRITHFSNASERCPPLAVLHTVTPAGFSLKIQPPPGFFPDSPLHSLHAYCLQDNKTAVMHLGDDELHLVAMRSRTRPDTPCFWGFFAASGLYDSCLVMLNLRCLGIVFDLDETLVVANTTRSFEDRIEGLQRKINCEVDPHRLACMIAELKRYHDDKLVLKQYVESDQVIDNGRVVKAVPETVPPLSDTHQSVVRPMIRLPERNIVLTRINPQIRDTSVLVRLRPAWEDLRSYLMARGRKRFEVYVCTMAERDYALEMWRLLDPDENLIQACELLNRIVCVKSGLRKSLFNVFQNGVCHPKMALVIDDRLKVWDENDQPRVHVVPAFAPYYAPQAEANNATPVLCVARNVACNIRGGFFKDFDDNLLQIIPEVTYEDDVSVIPAPPDVSNYLVPDEDNRETISFDGMADAEVERRLKEVVPSAVSNLTPRLISGLQFSMPSNPMAIHPPTTKASFAEQAFQNSPAREEGEVPESELDPDTRRRLLILQHGQDSRENPPPPRPPLKVSLVRPPTAGIWPPIDEEMSPRQLTRPDNDAHLEKHRPHRTSYYPIIDNPLPSRDTSRFTKEAPFVDDRVRLNDTVSTFRTYSGDDLPSTRQSSSLRETDYEPYHTSESSLAETPVGVLQEIASKCGARVEYRHSLVPSRDLQFTMETWLAGEKISKGVGRTRREAQRLAAEASIKHLAGIYISRCKSGPDGNFSGDGDSAGDVAAWDEGNAVGEKGWGNIGSVLNNFPPKRQSSPRSLHTNKRMKQDLPRSFHRGSAAARYKNASQVYD